MNYGLVCENCGRVASIGETFWTSKARHPEFPWRGMKVCPDCLYELDGQDVRGKSVGQVLHELQRRRIAEESKRVR